MQRAVLMVGLLAVGLAGCGPSLPNQGVMPSSTVQQGVVIGMRGVARRVPAMTAAGGVMGSLVEPIAADMGVFEYIIRKANADLVSVTQVDRTPLALWQNVRVIGGSRARVVPDYATSVDIVVVKPEIRPADAMEEETLSPSTAALQP